jgi:folate-binding protein YgfZ
MHRHHPHTAKESHVDRPRITGFFDASSRGLVSLSGPDALDLLHRISTNDISKLEEGSVMSTILTNEKGKMVDVVSVLRTGSDRFILVGMNTTPGALEEWLNKFIIMEHAVVTDLQQNYCHLIVFGEELPKPIVNESSFEPVAGVIPSFSHHGYAYRVRWSEGTLVHLLVERQTWDALVASLRALDVRPRDRSEFDNFRVDHAIPDFPTEISLSYNPLEANLTHLVSFTKGCYVGQEVIARLDTYKKVQQRLVRMKLEARVQTSPATLLSEKGSVGAVTTQGWTNDDGSVDALGYLQASSLKSHGELFVMDRDERIAVKMATPVEH